MTRQTKQTLIRGVFLFIAGVVGFYLQTSDQGLYAYFLVLFGIWEIGDVIANYFFGDEIEDIETEKHQQEVIKESKVDAARMTIPMLLSMMAELAMSDTGFRIYTLTAYLLVLVIYLLFIGTFTFFELKQTARSSKVVVAKKTGVSLQKFVDFERK